MKCKNCGKEFTPKFYNQVYCCKGCRLESHLGHKKIILAEKICPECHKKFMQHYAYQRYCSKVCQMKHNAETHREHSKTYVPNILKPQKISLDELEHRARMVGMHYGNYIAKMEREGVTC